MESKPLYKVNLWCLFLRSIYWFWTIIIKRPVYIRLSIIFYSAIKALELLSIGLSSYWPISLLTDDCWPESLYLCLSFLDGGHSHCLFPSSDFHRLESQVPGTITTEVYTKFSPTLEKSKHQTGFIHMPGHCSSCYHIWQLHEKLCRQHTKLPYCWSFISSYTLSLASE